jgi:hypothetical protein
MHPSMAWAVRRAGPRAAAGALRLAHDLFMEGRSREAWALVQAAAEARPGGADDASRPDPDFIEHVTGVAMRSAWAGQPWVMLAVQPLMPRWLHNVRRLPGLGAALEAGGGDDAA